jgi:phosphatidate cytidylyltransferase
MNNLIVRTITGAIFVLLIVASILGSEMFTFGIFPICAFLGMYEYRTLLRQNNVKLSLTFYILGLSVFYFIVSSVLFSFGAVVGSTVVTLFFVVFAVELFIKQEQAFQTIAYSVLGIIWIVIPFALINSMPLFYKDGRFLLLSVFIFIWLYDTFAYCVGMLFGKHRLFERVSPKKSWEGAIGSTVLTLTAAYFVHFLFPMLPLTPLQWMGLALIIAVFGTLGDLVESLFKRQLSVKDSGSILPGHGGILDRFDSILFAMPFVWLYLSIVLR